MLTHLVVARAALGQGAPDLPAHAEAHCFMERVWAKTARFLSRVFVA